MNPNDYPPGISDLIYTPGLDWRAALDAAVFAGTALILIGGAAIL